MDDLEIEVDDDKELDLDEGSSPDSLEESPSGESKATPENDESGNSLDDDDQQYSVRVKKRIAKEVWRRKQAEENVGRLNAEFRTLRAELDQIKSRTAAAEAQAAEGTLREKVQSAQQRLKQAKEDGDTDAEMAALDAYVELREKQRQFEQQRQTPQTAAQVPAGAQAWLDKNPWYQRPEYQPAARLAEQLDVVLQSEGFTTADPEMYVELNRRLVAAMPKMAKVVGEVTTQRQTRTPGPPTGSSSADGKSTPTKRTLTNADLAEMSKFGMNPDNMEHRKIWLRNHS